MPPCIVWRKFGQPRRDMIVFKPRRLPERSPYAPTQIAWRKPGRPRIETIRFKPRITFLDTAMPNTSGHVGKPNETKCSSKSATLSFRELKESTQRNTTMPNTDCHFGRPSSPGPEKILSSRSGLILKDPNPMKINKSRINATMPNTGICHVGKVSEAWRSPSSKNISSSRRKSSSILKKDITRWFSMHGKGGEIMDTSGSIAN